MHILYHSGGREKVRSGQFLKRTLWSLLFSLKLHILYVQVAWAYLMIRRDYLICHFRGD